MRELIQHYSVQRKAVRKIQIHKQASYHKQTECFNISGYLYAVGFLFGYNENALTHCNINTPDGIEDYFPLILI